MKKSAYNLIIILGQKREMIVTQRFSHSVGI